MLGAGTREGGCREHQLRHARRPRIGHAKRPHALRQEQRPADDGVPAAPRGAGTAPSGRRDGPVHLPRDPRSPRDPRGPGEPPLVDLGVRARGQRVRCGDRQRGPPHAGHARRDGPARDGPPAPRARAGADRGRRQAGDHRPSRASRPGRQRPAWRPPVLPQQLHRRGSRHRVGARDVGPPLGRPARPRPRGDLQPRHHRRRLGRDVPGHRGLRGRARLVAARARAPLRLPRRLREPRAALPGRGPVRRELPLPGGPRPARGPRHAAAPPRPLRRRHHPSPRPEGRRSRGVVRLHAPRAGHRRHGGRHGGGAGAGDAR